MINLSFIKNFIVVIVGCLIVIGLRAAPPSGVIVVSIDGGKPKSIQKSKMPHLQKMASEGAASWTAQTIYPSLTLPSHVSMLTGLDPKQHKVFWNDWLPHEGPIKSPTIFSIAHKQKLKSVMFAGKDKFSHFFNPEFLDYFELSNAPPNQLADLVVKKVRDLTPDIVFIHFKDADVAGHSYGWESPEQINALESIDKSLGKIIELVKSLKDKKKYTVIVSADHGGHEKTHGTSMPDDMTIPWIAWGHRVKQGSLSQLSINTKDTATTVLHLLNVKPPSEMRGRFIKEAFR